MSKNIENLNKESRIILFLKEVKEKNIKSRKDIESLYLSKYKLNEKSNSLNLRVIERFLGVYSKYSKEVKEDKIKVLKEELSKVKVDYKELLESYKEVKERSKRSNRLNNFEIVLEIEKWERRES